MFIPLNPSTCTECTTLGIGCPLFPRPDDMWEISWMRWLILNAPPPQCGSSASISQLLGKMQTVCILVILDP
ncbi:hypothetical protein MFUM_200011 [Methylacidiphilum fumariolicum SolV]|uniref:Uncharacterized protein n=2 Tax=Candidatus Methylacidiphilum fumarolicum TaxID=591154 RepID=I0JWT6_METFB|nr:conserved protein of unknown function [Candidatus Methylacidiphilum fumarolicum]CCG91705.1 hypothetical protein MFUM_200011 [Methylacidiphilum fumariolicum SolV]